MSTPVGESRADDRPWRRGPLAAGVRDKASRFAGGIRPATFVPRRLRMFPYTAPTVPQSVAPLPEDSGLGMDYDTDWARKGPAKAARKALQVTAMRGLAEALASPTVLGRDRIEDLEAPIIFAPNHHSHVDTMIVLSALPRRIREHTIIAAAGDYFFDTRLKATASALVLNAVPIERRKVNRTSITRISKLLSEGWNLVIFPEGGRSPDGLGQEFKPGASFLAVHQECVIVPVHIDGTDTVLPKGSSFPKRHDCTVVFGSPIQATKADDPRELARVVERAVDALAEESRTDWWTARRRAAAKESESLRGDHEVADWRRLWERTAQRESRKKPERSWP